MAKPYISVRHRSEVVARAHACCEYCLSPARYATQAFSIDHIIPQSLGGSNDLDNLALSCPGCNSHKAARTSAADPVDNSLVVLYNPRRHRWQTHFIWSEDYSEIIGITPIGRATVSALHLNRPALVNLRRILYAAGEHPPAHVP